jgi:hypothetical protein
MALMLEPEVILTAVLARDEDDNGVDYSDVRRYCNAVKEEIFEKTNYRCVSFGINADSLERCILDYPNQFSARLGRYHRGRSFKKNLFAHRHKKDINQILESAAANM